METVNDLIKRQRQVSHDIRSPLTVLEMLLDESSNLPEARRVLALQALSRIKDIANTLVMPVREDRPEPHLLSMIIETAVSEKRLSVDPGIKLAIHEPSSTFGTFIVVEPSDFRRLLMKVIDRVTSAAQKNGTVLIEVSATQESASVSVTLQDTHTKETMQFPKSQPPSWFVPALDLHGKRVVVLDDDASIHAFWQAKLQDSHDNIVCFSSPTAFAEWKHEQDGNASSVYLIDHDLGIGKANGLDVIKELGIEGSSILVTSHSESAIVDKCQRLGVRLIPKSLVARIPLASAS